MPHLNAAYNLARWLTRNEHDAQDVVQDAFLRAFKFFGGFHGGNSRSWLLSIVRNTAYTWLEKNRKHELTVFDEQLPLEFREALILRDLEGMSYKEIAEMADVPIGTVMSRLARARKQLQRSLAQRLHPGGVPK